jgi:hypothetical protein
VDDGVARRFLLSGSTHQKKVKRQNAKGKSQKQTNFRLLTFGVVPFDLGMAWVAGAARARLHLKKCRMVARISDCGFQIADSAIRILHSAMGCGHQPALG